MILVVGLICCRVFALFCGLLLFCGLVCFVVARSFSCFGCFCDCCACLILGLFGVLKCFVVMCRLFDSVCAGNFSFGLGTVDVFVVMGQVPCALFFGLFRFVI